LLYKFGIDVGKGDYRFKLRISSGMPETGLAAAPETYSTTFEVHIDDHLDDVYG